MMQRKGEPEKIHFRSDRVIEINGAWYFLVREMADPIGPCATKRRAEVLLNFFCEEIKRGKTGTEAINEINLRKGILTDQNVHDRSILG